MYSSELQNKSAKLKSLLVRVKLVASNSFRLKMQLASKFWILELVRYEYKVQFSILILLSLVLMKISNILCVESILLSKSTKDRKEMADTN